MQSLILPSLLRLDRARGFLLKKTLRISFFERLFTKRAPRLAFFFLLTVAIYLPLSLFFPIWVAVIGPIVYGVPHIIASIRYSKFNASIPSKAFFIGLWVTITLYRLLVDLEYWSPSFSFTYFDAEIASLVLSLVVFALLNKKSTASLLKGLILTTALVSAAWLAPIELTAFLLLFHNAVAFIYWIARSATKSDLIVSITSTLIFLIISTCILTGAFDFLFQYFTPLGFIAGLKLDYSDMGKNLAPWSMDYQVWFRFFVAYVFGQSLHYFVWLKAIPEQHLKREIPVTFSLSFKWLEKDFGKLLFRFLTIATLAGLAFWLFFSMTEARIIYFAIASYHGFHELAGLPFLNRKSA